jgi:hypothetical protein
VFEYNSHSFSVGCSMKKWIKKSAETFLFVFTFGESLLGNGNRQIKATNATKIEQVLLIFIFLKVISKLKLIFRTVGVNVYFL